jgi:hypothetical protein
VNVPEFLSPRTRCPKITLARGHWPPRIRNAPHSPQLTPLVLSHRTFTTCVLALLVAHGVNSLFFFFFFGPAGQAGDNVQLETTLPAEVAGGVMFRMSAAGLGTPLESSDAARLFVLLFRSKWEYPGSPDWYWAIGYPLCCPNVPTKPRHSASSLLAASVPHLADQQRRPHH